MIHLSVASYIDIAGLHVDWSDKATQTMYEPQFYNIGIDYNLIIDQSSFTVSNQKYTNAVTNRQFIGSNLQVHIGGYSLVILHLSRCLTLCSVLYITFYYYVCITLCFLNIQLDTIFTGVQYFKVNIRNK